MSHKDPQARRDCRNRHYRAWKDDLLDGKSCFLCFSTSNLEFHHREPAEKINHRFLSLPKELRQPEIDKCEVVCKPCHKRLTSEWYAARRKHGTATMYRHGCRCEACRGAVAAYRQARKAATVYAQATD